MHKVRCGCAAIMLLMAGACHDDVFAGGWDRFDQGIDLLFDPGKVVFDVGLFYLVPNRKFNTVNGKPETVNTTTNFFRPSVNAKFVPFEDTACLASYRQPFGLINDYGSTWSQAGLVVSRELTVEELGLTCSYRVKAGPGYIRLIGGVTEDFATYHEEALRGLPNGSFIRPALDLDASATGWRAGLAYEIPSKAFRASLMYYSNMDFSARGSLRQLPLGGNAFLNAVNVNAETPLPRAVEAAFHTAIAPAWLNSISVKWVDWSTLTSVPVILSADAGPLRAGRVLSTLNAFFRDGLTISDTVTHRWTDNLALSVRLGWDRGRFHRLDRQSHYLVCAFLRQLQVQRTSRSHRRCGHDLRAGRRNQQSGATRRLYRDHQYGQYLVHQPWVQVSVLDPGEPGIEP